MASAIPGVRKRPSTRRTCRCTWSARGWTPRTLTFASVPVWRSGRAAITTTSGLTRGTFPSRATWGASSITRTSSIVMMLVISLSAPARWTIALSASPEEVIVALKPRARASMATNTPTVPAMPSTATSEEVQRAPALRRL